MREGSPTEELSSRLEEWAKCFRIAANVTSEVPEAMFSAYDKAKLEGMAAGLYLASKKVWQLAQDQKRGPEPGK